MNIVTHSVSNYECILYPGQWRIVFLFRNVWKHNIDKLNDLYCNMDDNNNNNNDMSESVDEQMSSTNEEESTHEYLFDHNESETSDDLSLPDLSD